MSAFLSEFAGLLARAPRDASVAKTWSDLLPLVCRFAGEGWSKGGLWLLDHHYDHTHLTLWHWWAQGPAGPGPSHVTSMSPRDEGPASLDLQLQDSKAQLEQLGFLAPDAATLIAPIEVLESENGGGPQTIGLLALFCEGEARVPDGFQEQLAVACNLVGAWMNLNREWRKASALAEFQKSQNEAHDPASLAQAAAKQLGRFASARVAAAIYVPEGGELTRLGYLGGPPRLRPIGPEAFVHRFHFGQISGFRRVDNEDEVQIEFDGAGRFIAPRALTPPPSLADFPELEPQGGPLSILVARIRDTQKGAAGPPIATLMMATRPDEQFLGGRFSDTNRTVMRLMADAFRNAYSLALQRDRMAQIAEEFDEIAKTRTYIDINDDAGDQLDYVRFARLTRDTLPNVADAVISNVNRDHVLQNCWRADGITTAPPWWLQDARPQKTPVALTGQPARWVWSQKVEMTGEGGTLSLDLLLTAPVLPQIEMSLLDRIIAEVRIEQYVHVNKDDWARQLAEVRHNMRAVLGSLLGKAELLSDRYEAAIRNRDVHEVYRRLVLESPFRKNIRALAHAGKELEAIFENIRALVGKLDEHSLQLSAFDLSALIRSTLLILELEAERRGLNFRFIDMMQNETRRIVADPIWTRIVLFNLFENAIKYSDRGNEIDVVLQARGGHWQLRVVNTGRYIPPDMRERIFEAYQRVLHGPGVQSMPGTGLGLMTVRRYVNLHQNRESPVPGNNRAIVVESEPLERLASGRVIRARTSFTISVPRKGPDRNG